MEAPVTRSASQWGIIEIAFEGPRDGNPFAEVQLSASFAFGQRSVDVGGFYDGEGRYFIRFMPDQTGTWTYRTMSNSALLHDKRGSVAVTEPEPNAHGPVRATNKWSFHHADGTPFLPVGTTVYALPHQNAELVEQTLVTLGAAPFNKVRLCVFPKHFKYNENEPQVYPFEVVERGGLTARAGDDFGWRFDLSRPNPAFFRELERIVARLGTAGIEADLILFHPYDRWGFSHMSGEEDAHYLRYLIARLGAFANVWWSMANEFDLLPSKSAADWNRLLEVVHDADPYGHLRSVHNCFRFFDHSHRLVTHVSVQRENSANVALWSEQYGKPAIDDECGYEGDLSDLWGNLSGQDMVHRFWEGMLNGGFVTHGETFRHPDDVVFWSKGGRLQGESIARIAFLKRLLGTEAAEGLEPLPSVQRLLLLAGGPENLMMSQLHAAGMDENAPAETRMVLPWFYTLGRPHSFYLSYFGSHQPSEIVAAVPHGEVYSASLIDTWAMTEIELAGDVVRGQVLQLRSRPYQALALRRRPPA